MNIKQDQLCPTCKGRGFMRESAGFITLEVECVECARTGHVKAEGPKRQSYTQPLRIQATSKPKN